MLTSHTEDRLFLRLPVVFLTDSRWGPFYTQEHNLITIWVFEIVEMPPNQNAPRNITP